jgi:hypothetical protein
MSATPTVFDYVKSFMGTNVLGGTMELIRLIPDSILYGSLFLYILTHNFSFGIFAIFILEMSLSHRLISWVFSQVTGESRSVDPKAFSKCYHGYRTPRYEISRMLNLNQYPAFGTYSITAIATYIGLAMGSFKQTLNTMGIEWSSRYAFSMVFILLIPALYILIRYLSGCETLGEMMIGTVFGIMIALIFYFINSSLCGQESMNFLGLPLLINKSDNGSSIYVCSTEENNN